MDEATAERALGLIRVRYEELPAIYDIEDALKPDAPLIHEDVRSYHSVYEMERYGNVACHIRVKRGDVEKAFSEADYVFEDRFATPLTHNGYIEPHAAVAQVDRSGNITVWASVQSVFMVRQLLATIFKVPYGKIRVIVPTLGGGFGGKLCDVLLEPACVALSQKTGRPVKIVMTREEEFIASNPAYCGNRGVEDRVYERRHPSSPTGKAALRQRWVHSFRLSSDQRGDPQGVRPLQDPQCEGRRALYLYQ